MTEICGNFSKNRVCSKGVTCSKKHPYDKSAKISKFNLEVAIDVLMGRMTRIEDKQNTILEEVRKIKQHESVLKAMSATEEIKKLTGVVQKGNQVQSQLSRDIDSITAQMATLQVTVKENSRELANLGISGIPTSYTSNFIYAYEIMLAIVTITHFDNLLPGFTGRYSNQ